MPISTNGAIITRVAGALYNEYLSNATYAEVKDKSAATVAADWLAADFAGKTDAFIATKILANLGLSSISGLDNWVAAQLTAAGSTAAAKGAKLVSMLNDYSQMTADATYGSYATAFNTRTDASLLKSQTAGAAGGNFTTSNVAPASSGTFTLTTGNDVADANSAFRGSLVDSFRFTSGNETISAGISTLGANDIFIDSTTSDTDVLNATLNGSSGAFTAQNIETINATAAAGTVVLDLTNVIGAKNVNVNGTVAARVDGFNAATAAASRPEFASNSYTNALSLRPATLAGTSTTAETINVTVTGASYGTTTATRSVVTIDGNAGNGQLETLNLTSSGTVGNDYALNTANNATLGTVNLLGAADTTVRVTHADITGVTVAGALNTGNTVLRIDRNGATSTPTAAQNFTGLDKIQIVDSSGVDDDLSLTGLYTGASIEALSGFNAATVTIAGSAARTTDSLTVTFDHATANTSVALGTLNVQDVETMNLVTTGNSSALVGAGNTATITGDATTVTITGDTSLNLTINVDAPSSGSRTTAVNASAVTGTATVTLNASGDTNTANLYNLTGTANSDTLNGTAVAANTITGGDGNDTITGGSANDIIDGGTGNDNITASAGIDQVTGGTGNDTVVIPVVAATTAAVAETQTITPVAGGQAADAAINFVVNILGSDINWISDATPIASEIVAGLVSSINASAGALAGNYLATDTGGAGTSVTVTFKDTLGDVANMTIKALGGTAGASLAAGSATAAKQVTTTIADGTTGTVGDLVDAVWGDFAAGDLINKAALTGLATGGYYEGAIASMTATTDYGLVVITDQSYSSNTAVETAIDTKLTNNVNTDMIYVYLDSTLGYAVAVYDSDIDSQAGTANGAGSLNQIITFTGITTLSALAAAFANDGSSFV